MAKHIVLSDGEWKLMKLLWENHPMTLGDMVEAMQDDTAWSKGTIFTMLRRMSTKGVIRSTKRQRRNLRSTMICTININRIIRFRASWTALIRRKSATEPPTRNLMRG